MYTKEQYLGGAVDLSSATSASLSTGLARVVRASPSATTDYFLPIPGRRQAGGPWWLIINRSATDIISIRRQGGALEGTVPTGKQVYIFLTEAAANSGEGAWIVAGAGNTNVGNQGPGTIGFDYGNALLPNGLEMNLGGATPLTPTHGEDIDFGFAGLSFSPVIPF